VHKTILFFALLIAAACPVTGQTPPIYDVKVQLDKESTGTATFVVDRAGNVTGTMRLDSPNVVEAKLAGTIKDGTWTFAYPFQMPDQKCSGIANGNARVTPDLKSVSGTVTIMGG